MVCRIEQGISFSDRDPLRSIRDLLNFVSRTDLAFGDNTAIEPWPAMGNKQGGHLRIVHANSQAIAGDAGLTHFKDRSADPVSVPNANLIVGQTFHGEILTKLSVLEVISAEFSFPIPIGFELIDHNGTVFAAMAREIALAIAVQIKPSSKHTPGDRAFPDRGTHDFPLPCNVTWQANIDRQKFRHWLLQCKRRRLQERRHKNTATNLRRADAIQTLKSRELS